MVLCSIIFILIILLAVNRRRNQQNNKNRFGKINQTQTNKKKIIELIENPKKIELVPKLIEK